MKMTGLMKNLTIHEFKYKDPKNKDKSFYDKMRNKRDIINNCFQELNIICYYQNLQPARLGENNGQKSNERIKTYIIYF